MKNLQFKTVRMDYENKMSSGGYMRVWGNADNFLNPEQIYEVHVWSIDENDLIDVQKELPKSMQRKIGGFSGAGIEEGSKIIVFRFNTLFPNKVTGEINETAINARKRVLKHLSEKLNIEYEK